MWKQTWKQKVKAVGCGKAGIDLPGVCKKTFTPVGVPGCKPGATLVPETRVAAAQHVYSFQALLDPPSAHKPSSEKPGFELPTACFLKADA